MQLFPAIDLRGGQVVRLTQGDYDRMTVYGQDPCAQARSFVAAGAKNLHVVDLDGAKDGTLSNYDTIAALAKQGGLYIEVGGGIRTEERIEKYLSLGVGRCILGSVAVTDFTFTARMLQKNGDKIATTVEAIPEPTEAEKTAQKEAAARSTRDYYLSMTDFLVVNDYPITSEERDQVLEYRQALRDIPQARTFPENIVWPEPPVVAKAAHKYWKSAQVADEIKQRLDAVKARTDLDEEQKTKLTAALQAIYQQDGYPYEVEWPVEEEVLANE